jgi:phosphoserine phosphatase
MNQTDTARKQGSPAATAAHQWSTEEFERLAFESKPKVAVFDCDGTLWGGDAGYGFMAWSLEQGLVSRSTNDWIDSRYRAYRNGEVSEAAMCGEMVQLYAGLRESELEAAAARYVDEFVRLRVFAEMAALVKRMRQAEIEIWAVSSTNRWVITEGLRDFGIPRERILAAEVRVREGIITDQIVDVPTDEAKAIALKRVGLPAPDAVFGNSIHDLAMLEMARRPFPVNPSPALLEAAAKRGWGYYRPRSAEGLEAKVGGE